MIVRTARAGVLLVTAFACPQLFGGTVRAEERERELPQGARLRIGNPYLADRNPADARPVFVLMPPDYKVLARVTGSGSLWLLDPVSGVPLDGTNRNAPAKVPPHVLVSADGKRALVVQPGLPKVVDARTGDPIRELKPPKPFILCSPGPPDSDRAIPVALSADGTTVAQGTTSAGQTSTVLVWNVDKDALLVKLPADQSWPRLALARDGSRVAMWEGTTAFARAGQGPRRAIAVWDVHADKQLFVLRPTQGGGHIAAAEFSPDGRWFASVASDGLIDLWDATTGKHALELVGRRGGPWARLAFAPDGRALAQVTGAGTVQRWSVPEGKLLDTTEPPWDREIVGHGLAFVTDERVAVWGRAGAWPAVWEAPSGVPVTRLPEHAGGVTGVAFSPDGTELLVGSADGRIVRWNPATGAHRGAVRLRPESPLKGGLLISTDASRAMGFGPPNPLFDLRTGAEHLSVPNGPIDTVARWYADDLTRAAIVAHSGAKGAFGTWTVWDLTARRKVNSVELGADFGSNPAPCVALSPSGERVVVVGQKPLVRPDFKAVFLVGAWDVRTGRRLCLFERELKLPGPLATVVDDSKALLRFATGELFEINYEKGEFARAIDPGTGSGLGVMGPLVFSPDGKRFATPIPPTNATWKYGVRVYEWPSGRTVGTFAGHTWDVQALRFSPDGKVLASGSKDGTVVLWDLPPAK